MVLSSTAGCALPIRLTGIDPDVPKRSLPDSIDALDQAETKRKIERLVQSPEMRDIERELIAGLVDGTLSTLSDEERSKRVGALMSKAIAGAMDGASTAMGPAQREALAKSVGAVVSKSIQSATDAIRGAEIGSHVAAAMRDDVGPAMQKALRENIAKGLAEVLKDEEIRRELGETARVLGREMVTGATEALAQAKPPNESGSPLSRISQIMGSGARLFESIALMLGVLVLALGVWIVRLMVQAKRYQEDAHRREAMTRLLEEVAKASEGKPWSNELLYALKDRLKAEENGQALVRKAAPEKKLPSDDSAPPRPSFA